MSEERTLNINLNYGSNGDGPKGPALTATYINYAVSNAHPQGLEGQQRRIYGRLQRKLDEAIEKNSETVPLEAAECDFLRKSFENCKVPAGDAKYFVVLEDEIETVTKR